MHSYQPIYGVETSLFICKRGQFHFQMTEFNEKHLRLEEVHEKSLPDPNPKFIIQPAITPQETCLLKNYCII